MSAISINTLQTDENRTDSTKFRLDRRKSGCGQDFRANPHTWSIKSFLRSGPSRRLPNFCFKNIIKDKYTDF